jgi:hypothetical protein
MINHFFSNWIAGVVLLLSLIIFHRLTFFLFIPLLDFFEYIYYPLERASVINKISQNPSFVFDYLIVLFFHVTICLVCFSLRYFLNHNITIFDIILTAVIPGILMFLYQILVVFILWAVTKNYPNIYSSEVAFKNILWLVSNTIILIIGNLIGWWVLNYIITNE